MGNNHSMSGRRRGRNDTSSSKSQSRKKSSKQQKYVPSQSETSLISFGTGSSKKKKVKGRPRKTSFDESFVITDAFTDVRQRYHIDPKELGHGHYGVVRKCMDRDTHEWYAIKSILKSKVSKVNILKREIEILAEVNHKNIIKLIEVHEDVKYLHLITELCTGGELFDRIIAKSETPEGHFEEKHAAKLVASMLDAIAYCHERHIVHRDLKPENFLFMSQDEYSPIKIIDFGLSRHEAFEKSVMRTKVGTPYYVAPEVLRKEYTKSCDIWSIGVITYILLCGYPPFYGDTDAEIFSSVKAGKFDFPSPEWDAVSDDAKDFIRGLLKLDQSERLTAQQALNHTWIKSQTIKRRNSLISHNNSRSEPFKKFISLNKLKKIALGYIATHLTETEVQTLTEMIKELDIDGNGKLPLCRLEEALASCEHFNLDLQGKLTQLRQDLSLSGEEYIVWKEFLTATENITDKSRLIREQKIRMVFRCFRKSKNNTVKVSDLIDLIGGEKGAGEILDMNQIGNRDVITYDEFTSLMSQSFSDSEDGGDDGDD